MLHYRSIRMRIAIPFVLLIVVATAGLALYLSHYFREAYLETLETRLLADLRVVGDYLPAQLAADVSGGSDLDATARHYSSLLDARVTFIAADGVVLGESDHDRTTMENHLYRPEIQQALDQGSGSSIRYSVTARTEVIYVAIALDETAAPVRIARLALPLAEVQAELARLNRTIFSTAAIAVTFAIALALLIASRTTSPVRQLKVMAQQVAAGNLDARLLPTTQDEVGQLTRAFNIMAENLQDKLNALTTEQSRSSSILDHMADGVLVLDLDGVVQMLNPAAARILAVTPEAAPGSTFSALVRHHRLIELWLRCQRSQQEQQEAVEIDHGKGTFLQVIITPQQTPSAPGYLVIVQDLTRIRRLETIRRDFISNVSHELRTPLASLSALVETLQDGALEDPTMAQRFLSHMERELAAMTQIVEELLELSRIESNRAPFFMQSTPIATLISVPVERMLPQASRAGLSLATELPDSLPPVLADAERIQQVLINLLHNAIKFTPAGGAITVSARGAADKVIIAVRDTGVGIAEEELSRIFERFYKADRARSSGGTGLGLAIAKHIIQAHRGQIWVESVEGRGSTFYFSLPVAQGIS
ncbi:MAG: HAMP domain-containing protein [Anaerolineae bacterium]|nr:HAMP domain-containing protein [Anaerolineae bacterium]